MVGGFTNSTQKQRQLLRILNDMANDNIPCIKTISHKCIRYVNYLYENAHNNAKFYGNILS